MTYSWTVGVVKEGFWKLGPNISYKGGLKIIMNVQHLMYKTVWIEVYARGSCKSYVHTAGRLLVRASFVTDRELPVFMDLKSHWFDYKPSSHDEFLILKGIFHSKGCDHQYFNVY